MTVTAEPFPGLDRPRRSGCLVLRQGLTLNASGSGAFGGYSAIETTPLSDEDAEILLLSDTGQLLALRAQLDAKGDIVGVASADRTRLRGRSGRRLNKLSGDSEGLARQDGRLLISFEGDDRLSVIENGAEAASFAAPEEDASLLGRNSGYEALAPLPGGEAILISEGKNAAGLSRLRRGRPGTPLTDWEAAAYRPAEDFSPTGADLDEATGDLFVLERAYSPMRGPRARVVRVPAERLGDKVVKGDALGRLGLLEGIDNMEGIDVRRARDGALLITLVSDDNFSNAQRTVLMSFGLAPGCEHGEAAEPAFGDDTPPEPPIDQKESG